MSGFSTVAMKWTTAPLCGVASSAVSVVVTARRPAGENSVRCEYVADAPGSRLTVQLMPAPSSTGVPQSQRSGYCCCDTTRLQFSAYGPAYAWLPSVRGAHCSTRAPGTAEATQE